MQDKIRAGDLRESIVIEAATQATNDFGEVTISWLPFAKRRAQVRGRRVDERISGVYVYAEASHEVTFRHTPGLTPDMRLLWANKGNRVMDIVSITDLSRNEGHIVNVKEQTG